MSHRSASGVLKAGLTRAATLAVSLALLGSGVARSQSQASLFIGPAGTVVLQGDPAAGTVVLSPSGATINGPVFFLNGSSVSGSASPFDLASLAMAPLKLDKPPTSAREAADAEARAGRPLAGGKTFFIGPDAGAFARSGSNVLVLAPGASGELGDIRLPFIRVRIAAPEGKPLELDSVVARRPQIGIFNALFLPARTRLTDSSPTAIAFVPAAIPAPVPAAEAASVVEHSREVASIPSLPSMPAASIAPRMAIAAFNAPVEDSSRVLAPTAPVEERVLVALELVPAPVEERWVVVAMEPAVALTPVEERDLAQMKWVLAPVEERSPVAVFRNEPEARAKTVALLKEPIVAPVQAAEPSVAVVAARNMPPEARAEPRDAPPVKLAAIQKRLPQIMIDRRGGLFFM